MIIWIIGLSGSGKTTLATELMKQVSSRSSKVVLLDGDIVREAFGNDLGHSLEDRKKNALRICGLCKLLDDQGFHVVCAILSLFQDNRNWNRDNLSNYYEVFLDVDLPTLTTRDPKGLYAKFNAGKISGLPGLDIEFETPKGSDLLIKNQTDKKEFLKHAIKLADLLVEAN